MAIYQRSIVLVHFIRNESQKHWSSRPAGCCGSSKSLGNWSREEFVLPFLAIALIFLGANFFGKVSEFTERLRPLVGKKVRVKVWGFPLSTGDGDSFVIHSVLALGAGFHVYLRPTAGGSPRHLKVAQPIGATTSDDYVEVKEAKYVQWEGKMLRKVTGSTALVLNIEKLSG